MNFSCCTYEELSVFQEKYKLTLNWEISVNPMKVENNSRIVGLIDCSFGELYGEKSIEINNFEVFEKGKNIGSEIVVEFLKETKNYEIYLYPYSKKSEAFWKKHGFAVMDDGTGTKILQCKNY